MTSEQAVRWLAQCEKKKTISYRYNALGDGLVAEQREPEPQRPDVVLGEMIERILRAQQEQDAFEARRLAGRLYEPDPSVGF